MLDLPPMLDLKSLAAGRWRIALEPPATPTGGVPDSERPWHYRIPAKYGHIGLWSTTLLYAYCDRPKIIPRLELLPGIKVVQRGDREVNAAFPPESLAAVAELLRAKRRRVYSEATLARKREAMLRVRQGADKNALPGPPSRPEGVGRGMGPSGVPAGPGAALR